MSVLLSNSLRSTVSALVIAVALAAAGCSSGNSQAILDPNTGKHAANWIVDHRVAFLTDPALCTECHGADLRGGISGVSCYSANYNGMSCHANGPGHVAGWAVPTSHGASAKSAPNAAAMHGFATCQVCHGSDFSGGMANRACSSCHGVSAPHPGAWINNTYTHTDTNTGNAPVCALCHTNGRNSPIAPPSPPAAAGTPPGCYNSTLCHGQIHSAPWPLHGTSAKAAPVPANMTGFSTCQSCHGSTFGGDATHPACSSCHGVNAPHPASWITTSLTHTNTNTGNAAVCALCHANGANSPIAPPSPPAPAGTPPDCFNNTLCHAQFACGSCHGIPPDGSTAPNVAGRHAPHMSVNAVIDCGTCHSGAGSGSALHKNGVVNVIFNTAYNAKTGPASFSAAANTCSNVSCHGGQATPNWLTGVINVNTQCTSCHAYGTAQYNSFNSGEHNLHVNQKSIACTECHDTTKLSAVHFNDLNTTTMTQAYLTLLNALNYTGTGGSAGTCTINCHNENHVNRSWW